ncbi:MAG: hypothetical protein Q9170_005049 [Blastenia crenularia]
MRFAPASRVMAPSWQFSRNLTKAPESKLVHFDNPSYQTLPPEQKIEEEVHSILRYYPVRIGEVIQDRYQVVGKLGHGFGSTVWLANEFKPWKQRTVALKIFTNDRHNQEEVNVYKHLMSVQSKHPGHKYVRVALDTLTLQGPYGKHHCIVHEPMLESTLQLLDRNPSHRFTEDLLKACNISPLNILLGVEDKSIFQKFIQAEQENPSARRQLDGYIIYTSRAFDSPSGGSIGEPLLSDLGAAVYGDVEHYENAQPNVYRAPEVMLKIWDLFEDKHLFNGKDPKERKYMTRAHLAEIIAILGPPPPELLKKGKRSPEFFGEDGKSQLFPHEDER